MARTITVKGTGSVSVQPDCVVISMELLSRDKEYSKAMATASKQLEQLGECLEKAGFAREDIKTGNFNASSEYEYLHDGVNQPKRVFVGFVCRHDLTLKFDFDTERLAQALGAIADCPAAPQFSIRFTVKEPSAVSEALLRSATENALAKAKVLCEASGVQLGELINIDYNWGQLNVYSNTRYELCEEARCFGTADCAMDIEPEAIEAQDTVTFVWEIK